MKFQVTITIEDEQTYNAREVAEGILARLSPVAACWPDEIMAESVKVVVTEGTDWTDAGFTVEHTPCDDCRALPGHDCHVDCSSRWDA